MCLHKVFKPVRMPSGFDHHTGLIAPYALRDSSLLAPHCLGLGSRPFGSNRWLDINCELMFMHKFHFEWLPPAQVGSTLAK